MKSQCSERTDRELVASGVASGEEKAAAAARLRIVDELADVLDRYSQTPEKADADVQTVMAIFEKGAELEAFAPGYDFNNRGFYESVKREYWWLQTLIGFDQARQSGGAEPALQDVAEAWQEAINGGLRGLVRPGLQPDLDRRKKQYGAIEKLMRISLELTEDEYLWRVFQDFDRDVLADCPEAQDWVERYNEACQRRREVFVHFAETLSEPAWLDPRRLAAGMETRTAEEEQNLARVWKLLQAADTPFVRQEKRDKLWDELGIATPDQRIVQALDWLERRDMFLRVLQGGEEGKFAGVYNAIVVRLFRDEFERYGDQIVEYGRRCLRDPEVLRLGPAVAQQSIVWKEDASTPYFRVRWTWPPVAYASRCVLSVSKDGPGKDQESTTDAAQEGEAGRREWRVTPLEWTRNMLCWVLSSEDVIEGDWVAVRAVVDLVLKEVISEPVVLGRIRFPSRRPGLLARWKARLAGRGRP